MIFSRPTPGTGIHQVIDASNSCLCSASIRLFPVIRSLVSSYFIAIALSPSNYDRSDLVLAPGEGFPFMLRPSAREGASQKPRLIFYRSPLFLYRSNILKNNPLPLTKIFLHCLQTGMLSKKTCPRRLTFRFSGRYLQCTGPGLWKDIRSRLLSPLLSSRLSAPPSPRTRSRSIFVEHPRKETFPWNSVSIAADSLPWERSAGILPPAPKRSPGASGRASIRSSFQGSPPACRAGAPADRADLSTDPDPPHLSRDRGAPSAGPGRLYSVDPGQIAARMLLQGKD